MKYLLKTALTASLTLSTLAVSLTAIAGEKPKAATAMPAQAHADTTLKAIKLDASWCPSCKAIAPKMAAARDANEFADIAFSTIDYTDKKKAHFWEQADALGVEPQLREFLDGKPKTGLVILFDTRSNQIVDVITQADDSKAMAEKLNQASA
ncbi:TlpA family protein disulfide reductase [Hirschia litorea]|uniref:TlpA family protein disulfide reductase n=1 Tax=Hirschia litorea TaxID=1199156 RepID=A0ABW2IKS4_9PROT